MNTDNDQEKGDNTVTERAILQMIRKERKQIKKEEKRVERQKVEERKKLELKFGPTDNRVRIISREFASKLTDSHKSQTNNCEILQLTPNDFPSLDEIVYKSKNVTDMNCGIFENGVTTERCVANSIDISVSKPGETFVPRPEPKNISQDKNYNVQGDPNDIDMSALDELDFIFTQVVPKKPKRKRGKRGAPSRKRRPRYRIKYDKVSDIYSNANGINLIESTELNQPESKELNQSGSTELNQFEFNELNQCGSTELSQFGFNDLNQSGSTELNQFGSKELNLTEVREFNLSEANEFNLSEAKEFNLSETKGFNLFKPEILKLSEAKELNLSHFKELHLSQPRELNLPGFNQFNLCKPEELYIPGPSEFNLSEPKELSIPGPSEFNLSEPKDINLPKPNEQDIKKTRRVNFGPVTVNLLDIVQKSKSQLKKEAQKIKEAKYLRHRAKKLRQREKRRAERYEGNMLDASQPDRQRGKRRQFAQQKKLSKLKQLIQSDEAEIEAEVEAEAEPYVGKPKYSEFHINYSNNVITQELDSAVTAFLTNIVRFQENLYERDPIKGCARRRYFVGFRIVRKFLLLKKIKILIVSPDIKAKRKGDTLDNMINNIVSLAAASEIPYVFALSRRKLGQITLKNVPISCVAVTDCDGTEKEFEKVLQLIQVTRDEYQKSKPKPLDAQEELTKEIIDDFLNFV